MPIYEYRCPDCGERFEKLMRMGAAERPPCPSCGKTGAHRLVSTIAPVGGSCEPGGGT